MERLVASLALVALATAVPAADAMPDTGLTLAAQHRTAPVVAGRLAVIQQDLRTPDAADAASGPRQDQRSPDAIDAATRVVTDAATTTNDDIDLGDVAIGAGGLAAVFLIGVGMFARRRGSFALSR